MPAEGVKVEEIDHGAIEKPVAGIPERPADDRPEPEAGHQGRRPPEPGREQRGRRQREAEQQPDAEGGVLAKEAEGNAAVELQREVEEGRQRLPRDILAAELCEHREFRGPVSCENHERGERAEPLRRHPERRSALSSRRAAASRGVTSGYSGSAAAGSK